MKAANLRALYWCTWVTWSLSVAFYTLAATWRGLYAHALSDYHFDAGLSSFDSISNASSALGSFIEVGWMFVLLAHTYIVWIRTPDTGAANSHPMRLLFYITLVFLVLSAVFGGIALPVWYGSRNRMSLTLIEVKIEYDVEIAYCLVTASASCFLLATAFTTRRATRKVEGRQSSDPVRWILLVSVPLWIVAEIVPTVYTVIERIHLPFYSTYFKFYPALLLHGIATLATIAVLPFGIMDMEEVERAKDKYDLPAQIGHLDLQRDK
ncbi:hypothetical protein DL96DRAFT_1614453 [Flagelloscypha sp. PMI_526]|nr:hypothetical protein DL96DRAFT_1614453 [Flagelloscypha sp. PMI_526]